MRCPRLLRALPFLCLFVLPDLAQAQVQSRAAALVRSSGLNDAQLSLYAVDLDRNQALIDLGGDTALTPASNMKVLTTAAALAALGPDFVFRTELRLIEPPAAEGKPPAPWLLVVGDGDPGFGDPRLLDAHRMTPESLLALWVKAVQDAGVKEIGRLIVDDRVFDRVMVHPSWPAGQLNAWYCAQVAGINFNDNCLDIYPQPGAPGAPGSPARFAIVPEAPFLRIHNQALTGAPDNLVINRAAGGNDLVFSGKVKIARTSPEYVTMHDPPVFFAQLLSHRLLRAGVGVRAIARPGDDEQFPRGRALHAVQTTLPAVLGRCNKNSQNLFAECLVKRLGRAVSVQSGRPQPGSWDAGVAAVERFVQTRLGPRGSVVVVSDGSGMSRDNRVSAAALVEVLRVMHADPKLGPVYLRSLSIAGQDGTLSERLHTNITGQVYGKSGYIAGVSTLSGYLVVPAGNNRQRSVAFSFLCNGVSNVRAAKDLQDRLVRLLDQEIATATQAAPGKN